MKIFESLHDATLVSISMNWEEGTVSIFCLPTEYDKFKKTRITFFKVKNVSISHIEEWGPSISINEVICALGSVSIEMQSGDIIKIDYLEGAVEVVEVDE